MKKLGVFNILIRIIRGAGFKRRSIEDFLKKLDFKLELPPLDWKKQVGSSSLGASFGVYMRNQMELKTGNIKHLTGYTHLECVVFFRVFDYQV